MIINFECKKCNHEFDCEMGKIGIDESSMRPTFESNIVCPRCGVLTMDDVFRGEYSSRPAVWLSPRGGIPSNPLREMF